MRRNVLALAGLLLLGAAETAVAEPDWDLAANVDVGTRVFPEDARWPGQASVSAQFSLALTAELRWRSDDGDQRVSLIPYLRYDGEDDERSLADLREAYWAVEGDGLELLAGVNTVFWGVTESVHLVDIINQTDAVADIDGEDKLGQPMVNLALQRDWGFLSFYALPYFRERTFPGVDGRLRTPLPVDADRASYDSPAGQNHLDFAFRYSHYFGDVDIGLSLFDGTSREPRLVPDASGNALLPHYDQITQAGIDLQVTKDAWLWKLEAIARDGYADNFVAAVGGFEYSFYQLGGSNTDLGVLLEYQYDGRPESEPFTLADNDVFAGLRFAMNDVQDTSLLIGVVHDPETSETLLNIEGERRLGQDYVIEIRARVFSGASPADFGYALASDDYVELKFSRYF